MKTSVLKNDQRNGLKKHTTLKEQVRTASVPSAYFIVHANLIAVADWSNEIFANISFYNKLHEKKSDNLFLM